MRARDRRYHLSARFMSQLLTFPVAHLNTSYRHFFLFIHEVRTGFYSRPKANSIFPPQFELVDKKELAPLEELNDAILAEDKGR
jgi:MOB kinase activator 1